MEPQSVWRSRGMGCVGALVPNPTSTMYFLPSNRVTMLIICVLQGMKYMLYKPPPTFTSIADRWVMFPGFPAHGSWGSSSSERDEGEKIKHTSPQSRLQADAKSHGSLSPQRHRRSIPNSVTRSRTGDYSPYSSRPASAPRSSRTDPPGRARWCGDSSSAGISSQMGWRPDGVFGAF